MADLPEPVDITATVSRPSSTDSIASRWPGRSASKPNASRAALGVQLPGGDRGRHLLGLLAIGRAVLELDHGVLALAGQALEIVALPGAPRALDDLVRDPRPVELLLDPPARVPRELDEHEGAAVQADAHGPTILP